MRPAHLGGVGEVAGDEEDVVFVADVAGCEEAVAGEFELVGVASSEDELDAGAAEPVGEREAEAAGAAGDDGDLAGVTEAGAMRRRAEAVRTVRRWRGGLPAKRRASVPGRFGVCLGG